VATFGLNSLGSGYCSVAVPCEYSSDLSGHNKAEGFLTDRQTVSFRNELCTIDLLNPMYVV